MAEEFGQILWPDTAVSGGAEAGAAKRRSWQDWGGRFQGNIPPAGVAQSVLSIGDIGAPQAIGVNLFRSDRQATLYNSDVRARVTYAAGRSGPMTFDCDWRGGFAVHASRLEVEAVAYAMPSEDPYQSATNVILAATAGFNGSRPAHPPTYTILPETVDVSDVRQIDIHALARRVALLSRYGTLGSTGDAPLGQIFLSFADAEGVAIAWIDASTTRGAIFGEGVSVPAGAQYIGLTNGSSESIDLGVVFHLGL